MTKFMDEIDNKIEKKLTEILIEEGRSYLIVRFFIIFGALTFVSFFTWATFVEIDEVSIAPGKIIPISRIKSIQHPTGGVVSRILVKNGDKVKKGQVLIEFDRELIQSQITEESLKLESLQSKKKYMLEQIKIKEKLVKKGLSARLSLLKLKSSYSDLKIRLSQNKQELVRAKRKEKYNNLRSPVNGIVHNLEIYTEGAVINVGSVLMKIIPYSEKMFAEVEISTKDIGHTKIGSLVQLKFATYDFGRFGGATGTLLELSPSTIDTGNRGPFYKGLVVLNSNKLGVESSGLPIKVGMTLTAEIITGKKRIIEYLLKPIFSSANMALRER